MAFTKFLATFTIILSIFSSAVLSMEEKDKGIEEAKEMHHLLREEKATSTHWGLSHWIAGIGEYCQRNFLCGYGLDRSRTDRAWVIYKDRQIFSSTDCLISPIDASSCCSICVENPALMDNPLHGIVCAPYMAATLLCTLPYALYHATPHQRPALSYCGGCRDGCDDEPMDLCMMACPCFYLYCCCCHTPISYRHHPALQGYPSGGHYEMVYGCCLDDSGGPQLARPSRPQI